MGFLYGLFFDRCLACLLCFLYWFVLIQHSSGQRFRGYLTCKTREVLNKAFYILTANIVKAVGILFNDRIQIAHKFIHRVYKRPAAIMAKQIFNGIGHSAFNILTASGSSKREQNIIKLLVTVSVEKLENIDFVKLQIGNEVDKFDIRPQ